MSEVVAAFSTSPTRVDILKGLLAYREELRSAGISGYQWLGGSFCEAVELSRNRPPGDIDLVTIGVLPATVQSPADAIDYLNLNPQLFRSSVTKWLYNCDAYFLDSRKAVRLVIQDATYWFGLFSHSRTGELWKGMIRVSLLSDDSIASQHASMVAP